MARRNMIKSDKLGSHNNPIPTGVVIGNVILPSVISGAGPDGISGDPEEQIRQAFENLRNVMEAAGGSTDNVGKVIFYLKDFSHRAWSTRSGSPCSPTRTTVRPATSCRSTFRERRSSRWTSSASCDRGRYHESVRQDARDVSSSSAGDAR